MCWRRFSVIQVMDGHPRGSSLWVLTQMWNVFKKLKQVKKPTIQRRDSYLCKFHTDPRSVSIISSHSSAEVMLLCLFDQTKSFKRLLELCWRSSELVSSKCLCADWSQSQSVCGEMLGQMAQARFTQASHCLQPQRCLLRYRYKGVHLIPTTAQHLLRHSGPCVTCVCVSMKCAVAASLCCMCVRV